MNPLQLTVGLPVYNGEAYLRDAIESLLAQSFTKFELLISDNCSTDSTPDICSHFAALDSRIVYRRNDHNVGAAANFNKVVDQACGQYFAWANHDDLWSANYFEECIRLLETRPSAVLAYSRSNLINEKGETLRSLLDGLSLSEPSPALRLRRFHLLHRLIKRKKLRGVEGLWTPIYGVMRTSTLRKTGLIGPYIGSDSILIEELLMHGEFLEVTEQLFLKREHRQRSMRECRSFDKRIEWFTGKPASRLLFPKLRWLRERIKATHRAPLARDEKLACYVGMLSCYLDTGEVTTLVKESMINLWRLLAPSVLSRTVPRQW